MGRTPAERKFEVILVPADQVPPNPNHPYARLTREERRARFVAILARLYRELVAEAKESQRAA